MTEEKEFSEEVRLLDAYLTALSEHPDDPTQAEKILQGLDEATAAEIRISAQTAQIVSEASRAEPSPKARVAGRQRLLSAVAKKRREKAAKGQSGAPASTKETTT